MIFADDVAELPAVRFADRRLWGRPDRGRIIADVVIAGKVAARDGQRVVQAFCKDDVIAAGRPVEGDVAAIDDEVGPVSVDVLANAMEVGDQAGEVSEICVRRNSDMRSSYQLSRVGTMTAPAWIATNKV